MNTRRWIAVGCAAGLVTIILFTVLATLAFGAGLGPTPRFTVFVVVNILIGFASISILTTAAAVRAFEERGDRYVKGVQDTVDRLAEALPPRPAVRRIS